MSSVAINAFTAARERLAAQVIDPPEARPAYEVFGPPPAPVPALGALPSTGAIAGAARALDAGVTTSVALTELALQRIAKDDWTAFVHVDAQAALAEARARDAELRAGRRRGPLHGVPVSVKDVIHVGGMPTRCGSDAFHQRPEADAAAVDLWRAAGAVILGKTSTHEFALGVTSPQARNPHDPTRIPGGSSGGSAIAVATGMGFASLGTDTRASIRVPAALCGVVGLKPTYETVPTRGVVPLSWTMDHVAVMAAGVEDAALALDALRPDAPAIAPAVGARVSHLRVGLATAAWEGAEAVVEAAVARQVDKLDGLVAAVRETDRPTAADFGGANAMGLLVSRCEAATFHRAAGLDRSLYWAEVRDQLDAADGVPATDYIDAQRYRSALREEMLAVFREHHVLAMPTAPVLAPPVERADEYLTILSRNAILWSFVGFPAISLPCPTDGLPVGLQLVAGPGGEALLIALAAALTEKAGGA
ncbi:aspartyl-tRNA(Asn)/glutamyl-tRNA(Gln) amidotransferase subunit A [Solirubrobacter pauli]|uniref:Aspartyl-tRNA(Asn)/glutamyl-tRNA(Gln) amidotransferase subunit A n=1 Tax=Solirubrobacter pauli TaxID=166793 RepID=A0A660LC85_9ACTN|nr:amidase [Solirubrobacter pauli]RKQ92622.1 aspartyl-tRNA(Asn)/glutamyl-tRNA(Gln) amidotransferase subunit A [Solirubrobacter pauli]